MPIALATWARSTRSVARCISAWAARSRTSCWRRGPSGSPLMSRSRMVCSRFRQGRSLSLRHELLSDQTGRHTTLSSTRFPSGGRTAVPTGISRSRQSACARLRISSRARRFAWSFSPTLSLCATSMHLIVEATERIIADPAMSLDSFRWIRTGRRHVLAQRDGVTIDTAGAGQFKTVAAKILPNLDAAAIDRIWLDATPATQTATAPVFGMILVPDRLDMAHAITAGRAWQRIASRGDGPGSRSPASQSASRNDRSPPDARSTARVRFGACDALREGELGTHICFQARVRAAPSTALAPSAARRRRGGGPRTALPVQEQTQLLEE